MYPITRRPPKDRGPTSENFFPHDFPFPMFSCFFPHDFPFPMLSCFFPHDLLFLAFFLITKGESKIKESSRLQIDWKWRYILIG